MSKSTTTLMQFQKLAAEFNDLQLGWEPKSLEPVVVHSKCEQLNLEQVKERLIKKCDSSGWLLQTSQCLHLPAATALLTEQQPLEGEGCSGETSWQLTYLGQNLWQWVEHQVQPVEPDQATHLAEETQHQATDPDLGTLYYQRLWKLASTAEQTPTLEIAVFTGFSGELA